MNNYSKYGMDKIIIDTFIPYTNFKSLNKTYGNKKYNVNYNQSKFTSKEEGFLRGNMEVKTYNPYDNMTYLVPNVLGAQEQLLYKIQQLDFALLDINLYLDVHPNDFELIQKFNEYNDELNTLMKNYENLYGPLSLSYGNGLSNNSWQWDDEPWPWQKEDRVCGNIPRSYNIQ